jgi:hypothetical protein
MGKFHLLRFAAWVPVGLFLGALIGWRDSGGPLAGIVFTARIFLLGIAALPLFAMGHFSKANQPYDQHCGFLLFQSSFSWVSF